MTLEYRAGVELRAVGARKLVGIAAPYDVPAQLGGFTEVFRRGCWAATLAAGADVVATQDHDVTRLLGRTRSGTLTLADEQRGLSFTLDLPDTEAGRTVRTLAERNDIGGVSVGMRVLDQAWIGDRREIRSAELVEVAIVSSFPAYPDTSVALRSRDRAAATLLDAIARGRVLDMI